MTDYIQHRKTSNEIVTELDAMITERLARNFGLMTLWHEDAETLLRRYREMVGEIETLRRQQQTDRQTIASLHSSAPQQPSEKPSETERKALIERLTAIYEWFDDKFAAEFPHAPIRSSEAATIEEAVLILEQQPSGGWRPDPVEVAKIIDPEAWDEISAEDNEEVAAIFAEAWEDALAKAALVLALPPPPVGEGS